MTTAITKSGNSWGWVEIHWSDNTAGNFTLGQYRCPTINKYDIQNEIPDVKALPSDYRTKTLPELIDIFRKENNDHQFQLSEVLEKVAKKAIDDYNSHKVKEINKAYICSSVEQWIIVEIQPNLAVEHGLFLSFPTFEVWSFLQPFGIGSTKRMKSERGYVTDDMPRAGWFRTSIEWFASSEPGNPRCNLIPKMSIHNASGEIVEWREVECKLTKGPSPYLDKHPIRPAYGQGYRFLFRIPVVVENIETAEDRERKKAAVELLKKAKNLTKEQADNILRLEAGSYLKVWVRNSKIEWSHQHIPCDDNTENCMRHMQLLDNSKFQPYIGDIAIHPFGTPVRVNKPELYKSYIDYYWDHFADDPHSTDLNRKIYPNPMRVAYNRDTYKNVFIVDKMGLKPLTTWSPVTFTFTGSEVESPPEPTETLTQPDDTRYQSNGDYFRPFSFRNHTWKRNRFSDDGEFKEDQWHYILLWPKEIIKSIDLLGGKFVSSPGQFNFLCFLGALMCYDLYVFAMSNGARYRKRKLKDKGRKPENDKFLKIIERLIELEDVRLFAGAFSLHGFNMKNEAGEGFTIKEMINRFKTEAGTYGAAAYIDKILSLWQQIIKTVIVDFDNSDKIRTNIREAVSMLLTNAPSSAQKYANASLTQKKSIKELYKKFKEDQKEDGKVSTTDESIIDMKIAMEYEPVNISKQLAAYPIPVPVLSWIVFAVSFKIASKLKLTIDGSNFFDSPKFDCSFDISGDCGFHAALGAFWTLYSQLDNTIIQKNVLNKPEGTPTTPLEKWVSEALSVIGLELAASISLEVTGALPFTFNCSPDELEPLITFARDNKSSMVVSVKIPVTGKLSIITTELFSLSFPILAASPSSIALFPSGIVMKSIGGFSSAFFSDFTPLRIKLSDGTITQPITGRDYQEIWAGKKFELSCESINIISPNLAKAGQKVPFFKGYLVKTTNQNEKLIDLETDWVFSTSTTSGRMSLTIAKCQTTTFSISTANLYSDEKYIDFISKLLKNDQQARLVCVVAGDINEKSFLGPEKLKFEKATIITVKKPFISRLSVSQGRKNEYTFSDRIVINFKADYLNLDCKLFCFCYEINDAGGKFEARIIKGKDKVLHYFVCYPQADGTYDIPIQLSELSHIKMKDESNDQYWELGFGIALDYDAKFLLQFTDRHPGSINHSSTVLKVKKLI